MAALRPRGLLFATAFGVAAGMFAIGVSQLEPKFAVAAGLALAGGVAWLAMNPGGRMLSLLAVFIFGITLKLSKTFFLIESSQWQYVPFAGGAAGLTIGANDVAAALLLATAVRSAGMGGLNVVWPLLSGPLLFMASGVASLENAGDSALVGFELARQALLLLSMLAAMNLTEEQLHRALLLLAASVVAQGAIASLQFVTNASLGLSVLGEQKLVEEQIGFQYQTRAVGTVGHSNILAYLFEITLPLMLALLMTSRGVIGRLPWLLAIGAGFAGVLVTLSRAAWVALPVTMTLVFLHFYARHLLRLRSAVYSIGVMIVASGAFAAAWPLISKRLFSDDAGSTDSRGPLNRAALSVIEQFPGFGVGLNNLANAFPLYDQTQNTRVFGPLNHVVHNLYLLVLAEVGIVGFLAFLWCFGGAFWIGWRLRHSPSPLAQAIGVGGAAGLVSHLIHGTFDPGFKLSLAISTLIAIQVGMIGAAWRLHRRALAATEPAPQAPVRSPAAVRRRAGPPLRTAEAWRTSRGR